MSLIVYGAMNIGFVRPNTEQALFMDMLSAIAILSVIWMSNIALAENIYVFVRNG